eukprot:m51a1_g8059 putative hydrolase and peroxidase (564) ;mRNA; f:133040-135191
MRTPASLALLLSLGLLSHACSNGIVPGSLRVSVDGQGQDMAVAQLGGNSGRLQVSGASMTGQHGIRAYLANGCPAGWSPDMYHSFPLLGSRLSFTVDLSSVHCGCNAAFYLISMPGYDYNGNPARSQDGDYYCDANKVGGVYCPEIDLMEANQYAFSVALHKCNAPQNKWYSWCDGGGCGKNFASIGGAYGPGDGYKINTNRAFTASFEFPESNGQLGNVVARLAQEGREVSMDFSSCGGYVQDLTAAVRAGMTASLSHWGDGTMDWLDGKWCSWACDKSGRVTISNLQVTSGTGPTPPTPSGLVGSFSFKSFFGTYLSAQQDGSIQADRSSVQGWEVFDIQQASTSGAVYIKSAHGKYLSANPTTGGVTIDRDTPSDWETFFPESRGNDQWVFRTTAGRYLTVEDNPRKVAAWNREAKGWETFTLQAAGTSSPTGLSGRVSFRSFFNTYLSSQNDGTIQADRSSVQGAWEVFSIEQASTSGAVYIKGAQGKYLSANPTTGGVTIDRDTPSDWETFFPESRGNGQWVFRTTAGRYLTVEDSPRKVAAWNREAKGWETFTVNSA